MPFEPTIRDQHPPTKSVKHQKRIEQIETLGSYGYTAQNTVRFAWNLAYSGDEAKRDHAEELCLDLLRDPRLADLHKAACHLLLAGGREEYVWHAEQAVDLYENLYTVRPGSSFCGDFTPSAAALASQQSLLAQARSFLDKARADEEDLLADYNAQMEAYVDENGRRPTDDELIQADIAAFPQLQEHMERVAESMRLVEEGIPDDDPSSTTTREDAIAEWEAGTDVLIDDNEDEWLEQAPGSSTTLG